MRRPASRDRADRRSNPYLAFAEWRLEQRSIHTRRTVKYFRQSRDHMILWTFVIRGHYTANAPSCNDCIREVPRAKETARKLLLAAVAKGYFELRPSPIDRRKKLVHPSRQCVREYENMVDILMRLPDAVAHQIHDLTL
ncbi:MAG TPA: hypothetical protein VL966_15875 [Alphaproteobacteria bacterium]|jgi:hypothetical protein|nr:hypothetical protein [Alphaproteobacteria bacterium]